MNEAVQRNKMGYAKMLPLILSMSIPAMFSMTIQALYNIVDSMFVSKLSDGTAALEATSLAYPLQMLLVAVAVGTVLVLTLLYQENWVQVIRVMPIQPQHMVLFCQCLVGYRF